MMMERKEKNSKTMNDDDMVMSYYFNPFDDILLAKTSSFFSSIHSINSLLFASLKPQDQMSHCCTEVSQ